MDLERSVLVRIDPHHRTGPHQRRVRWVSTGRLVGTNPWALRPLIHHARALTADTGVVVGLTSIDHLETAALGVRGWEAAHDDTGHHLTGTVRLTLTAPYPLTECLVLSRT